ncbi:MAG: flagellar biosynthesis protein FlaG [Burkholderiaceae bacterium]|jgi:flagellar protein FlaG|uniref:Flagellar protein FlaG n=1 Tax=Cupriavidus metallidurans TaxID=119219 RepID=A0A482IW63_9BURK|nr:MULTISPECIES: flagellar protein FlaG [Cupriavidus]KWR85624.1 flagellar biosynthesis protein FlaG [Cupriavidus sp. SHE]PCH54863.1 MAG: flagellar biosynthesis protein FlaG [Burkholderiaceae bacterium]QBP13208.1 flagellar protein FlaG [Cupriavidus metallidurans]
MATQAAPSSGVVQAAVGVSLPQPGLRASATPADASQAPVGVTSAAPAPDQPAVRPSTDAAVRKLTEALRAASVSVQFEIDRETNRVVTKIVDKANGEIIRQIPTEEVVRIADALAQLQGLFVNQTA